MPTNTAATLPPFTAWEQAVFVALFIFMVIGLLYWFSRQQEVWQRFIQKRDEQWQTFLKEQRDADTEVITEHTQAIRELLAEFRSHDTWEHTKLDEMSKAVSERKTTPRK